MYISERARVNLRDDPLAELRRYCFYNQYDEATNSDGVVALAIAENKLMHNEISKHINENFAIDSWNLTYAEGPGGSRRLRRAIAAFVNQHFNPHVPVEEKQICVSNGAGSSVDSLAFCMGEPGDGILVGRPLYVGFFPDLQDQAKIKAVLVDMDDVDPTSVEAVTKYEHALQKAKVDGIRIRGILLANPHNPLGRPYTKEALIGYMQLCSKYDLHLISDEVYVKSFFSNNDISEPSPFLSVLSLDASNYINPALVHVLYGMSKDFCANGVRVGCCITQANPEMLRALKSVASFCRPSTMAEIAWQNLLEDQKFMDAYFPLLQQKMTAAYNYVTDILKQQNIPYVPVSATSYIWMDLKQYLREDSVEAEMELGLKLAHGGVWVAMGKNFGSEKCGNFRLTFTTPEKELKLGMERFVKVLKEVKRDGGNLGNGVLQGIRQKWQGRM